MRNAVCRGLRVSPAFFAAFVKAVRSPGTRSRRAGFPRSGYPHTTWKLIWASRNAPSTLAPSPTLLGISIEYRSTLRTVSGINVLREFNDSAANLAPSIRGEHHHGYIVLKRSVREIGDRFEHAVLQFGGPRRPVADHEPLQPLLAELLFRGVLKLGDAVGDQHQAVARLELARERV